jgi:tellurite resistance protein TerC
MEFILFNLLVLFLIFLDLAIFNKSDKELTAKKALLFSFFWIFLSLSFCLFIYFWKGKELSIQFLTAYLVEKTLSVDNLFVFIIIFQYFHIPRAYQHKVLIWGIIGALVMRAVFILIGFTIIAHFHFFLYLLALFLIFAGLKIIFNKDKQIHPEKNPIIKFLGKFIPITPHLHNENFFIKSSTINSTKIKWLATPLFLALITIETTDVIFAIDSIPAVLAITHDPFIAYSSNIFAVLGLRALYFAISHLIQKFSYLHFAIGIILVFVGLKMLIEPFFKISSLSSLIVIVSLLSVAIFISIYANCRKR